MASTPVSTVRSSTDPVRPFRPHRLPFYQDKLYEEKVFKRFAEILSKARSNKQANKPDAELNEFETVRPFVRRWSRHLPADCSSISADP